jgi:hypothetical protein
MSVSTSSGTPNTRTAAAKARYRSPGRAGPDGGDHQCVNAACRAVVRRAGSASSVARASPHPRKAAPIVVLAVLLAGIPAVLLVFFWPV